MMFLSFAMKDSSNVPGLKQGVAEEIAKGKSGGRARGEVIIKRPQQSQFG